MIKYVSAAAALRCFSSNRLLRSFYRQLGNRFGDKRRSKASMPEYYVDRLKRMIRLTNEHGVIRDGYRILEVGTGWYHWEALTLRLLFEIEAVLFDVWDNRQLLGMKNYVRQLKARFGTDIPVTGEQLKRGRALIESILKVESFEQLYQLLGFRYVVQSDGSLEQFQDNSFDLIVSGAVLEHVKRESLPSLAANSFRILKPGGFASHSIDTSDHLSHYDPGVCKKMYLQYSETAWRLFWGNELQYINRVQRGEWLHLFTSHGFEIVDEDSREVDITRLKIAQRYENLPKRDLATTVVRLLMKKPVSRP